jgi:hypothetical protein
VQLLESDPLGDTNKFGEPEGGGTEAKYNCPASTSAFPKKVVSEGAIGEAPDKIEFLYDPHVVASPEF